MKLPLPSDFFAPVRLSPSEVHDLQQVEARLLTGYLTQYDAYCTRQDEDSHEDVWKLVGQRFGVKIFSQKPKKSRRRHRREQEQLPALRLVGSVDGTLEDILYGSMWRSGRERAARAHFTRDGVADGAVLCTVEKPSPVEPFRSLSVKWMLKRAPHGGLVVKDRDFCYLAASGVVHSPKTGRKLGFRVRHSMTFPSCPPFENHSVVRGRIFFCSFFRQLHNGRLEVFHQGSYDAGGGNGTIGLGLPRSIAEKSVAESLLSLADVRLCALAKKLSRAIESCDAEHALASLSSTSVQESLDGERRCGMCLRRLGTALKRRCAACRHWACPQCSVRQETVPSARFASMKAPVFPRCFCKACVARVLRDDAMMYAVGDASRDGYEVTGGRWGHDEIPEEDEEEMYLPNRRHSIFTMANSSNFGAEDMSRPHRAMTTAAVITTSAETDYGARAPVYHLSTKQVSVDSDAVNTISSSPSDNHRRRSATLAAVPVSTAYRVTDSSSCRRRPSANTPDILLRSDVGRRNWTSSTSALSLQSPQRHIDGSPIVNVQRRLRSGSSSPSMHRISFGSSCSSGGKSDEVRVRICTPKRNHLAAAYTPYFATASMSSRRASPDLDSASTSSARAQRQFFRGLYNTRNPATNS